jgi:hypothetical protein
VTDRLITADARTTSGADFFRQVFGGDPNDISNCAQAGGYYYRDGGWRKIRDHHVGVAEQTILGHTADEWTVEVKELPNGRWRAVA